jgi:F-type H+-transporting ATPase subunit epsilon
MSIIFFEIVTPERVVLREDVLQITAPTKMGEITVLPDHIPLVATLAPGVIEVITKDNNREVVSVSGGFIEVFKDKVVVLADTAERAEEIDLIRAEEARARAEKLKADMEKFDRVEFADISSRIAKELARAKAAKRWKKIKNIE